MDIFNQLFTDFRLPTDIVSYFNVSLLLDVFFLLSIIVAGVLLVYGLIKLLLLTQEHKQPFVIFEVKPLRVTEQNPYTTEQLFNLIHSLANQRPWLHRFFNVSKSYAFEIVSTKEEGIRYLTRVNENDAELVKKSLLSYLPGISVKQVDDYLSENAKHFKTTEFKLLYHFAFPLRDQDVLAKHDPIAYITGNMTKVAAGETIAFQVVVSPLSKASVVDIKRISKLIYTNKDLVKNIKRSGFWYQLQTMLKLASYILFQILLLPVGIVVFIASDGKEGPFLFFNSDSIQKSNNPYQTELERVVKGKLDQQLFNTSIRLLVVSKNRSEGYRRVKGLSSALASFNTSYQALVRRKHLKLKLLDNLKGFAFKNRLILPLSSSILSVNEVSDLYHFPFTSTTKTEDLVKTHSKELPAPVSLKRTKDLDITFAQNEYGGSSTPIGLSLDERRRHMYILGATGTGKSTMLLSMIDSDLRNGKGLAVIDPHGDLIEDILQIIPNERIKDVVYFNPDDIGYPMGINVLELSEGLSEEDALREREFITESVISLFHKVYTEKYSGPRLEYILRNTIHTAFTIPDATLFSVNKLLINTKFRKTVVRNLTDENLKEFWKYEFAKAGDYQKVNMVLPITNKIGRFLFSPTAKRILEQSKSTIDFDEIMNEGKILLCNLSKGKIGEDNSKVFGAVMMAKLQLAALKRARIPMDKRIDFYLYVDEFQNFASESFAQILSEARKYKLNAVLAHQTTSQLEDKSLVNVTLANTGTVICFRTANPEDERLILPQFRPYIEQGEIASLPSYRFYMRLGALNPEEPFSGVTIPVKVDENVELAKKVIETSRMQYAIKYVERKPMQVFKKSKLVRKKSTSTTLPAGILP